MKTNAIAFRYFVVVVYNLDTLPVVDQIALDPLPLLYLEMSSLNCLPDEIIHHILTYVSPEDNLSSVQLVSRRLNHVANETLLWRYHCQTSFSFWHPDHRFQDKLASTPSHVEWKKLWIERTRNNATAARLLDDALATKVGRYGRIQQICLLGYDVKDFLLEQCRVDESAEDVLARR